MYKYVNKVSTVKLSTAILRLNKHYFIVVQQNFYEKNVLHWKFWNVSLTIQKFCNIEFVKIKIKNYLK